MKVLYVDLICPIGHVFYNNIQISLLKKKYKVDYIFQEGYANKLDIPTEGKVYEFPKFVSKSNVLIDALRYRFYMEAFLRFVCKIAKKGYFDVIFISSFETFSFCLHIPYECSVIAICHNNIDYIQKNIVKRFLLRRASKKINFVVLNKTLNIYFNSIGIKNFLIPHGTIVENQASVSSPFLFMPVNDSVDIKTLNFLLSDDFLSFLSMLNLKLYIKQKYLNKINKINKINNCIVPLPNYLDLKTYNKFLDTAMAVILPYDMERYKFRSSGLFYEAIGKNKVIIVPNTPNFECDKCNGDKGIFLYTTPEDIINITNEIVTIGNNHSYDRLLKKMDFDIVKNILN